MNDKGIKVLASNKKAFHEYSISDTWEAGIALQGTEVKALRDGKVNLTDGWVDFTPGGQAMLREVHIGHYSHGNIMNHLERRSRVLLLHKREIEKLMRASREKGFSIVPLKIYFSGRFVKVEIGLGKGKKAYDKRDTSKEKDARREIDRVMKSQRR
jgi:SsrA-binding protein